MRRGESGTVGGDGAGAGSAAGAAASGVGLRCSSGIGATGIDAFIGGTS